MSCYNSSSRLFSSIYILNGSSSFRVNFYSCSIFEYFVLVNVVLNDTGAVTALHISDLGGLVDHLLLVVWRVQIKRRGAREHGAQSHGRNRGPLVLTLVRRLLLLKHVVLYVLFCLFGRHGDWSLEAFALGVLPVQHLVEVDAFVGS